MREEIEAAVEALDLAHKALRDAAYALGNFRLLDGTAPIIKTDWRPREEVPPKGHIWASDGEGIWLIHSDGQPIPASATAVKFWTQAFIPCPPNHRPTIDVAATILPVAVIR